MPYHRCKTRVESKINKLNPIPLRETKRDEPATDWLSQFHCVFFSGLLPTSLKLMSFNPKSFSVMKKELCT